MRRRRAAPPVGSSEVRCLPGYHPFRRRELGGVARELVVVAVAVIVRPAATLLDGEKVNEPLPDPSTVRPVFWPMKVWPSSVPEGFEKNWTVYVAPGRLLRVPFMVVFCADGLGRANDWLVLQVVRT